MEATVNLNSINMAENDQVYIDEIIEAVKKKEQRLNELYKAIQRQDEINHAKSIAARAFCMEYSFTLDAQVFSLPSYPEEIVELSKLVATNRNGDYILQVDIRNKSGILFLAKLWLLQVSVSQNNVWNFHTFDLKTDFGDTEFVQVHMNLTKINASQNLLVRCNLLPKSIDSIGSNIVPLGCKTLTASYFYQTITADENDYESAIKHSITSEQCPSWEKWDSKKIRWFYGRSPTIYTLALPPGLTQAQVWRQVLKNCASKDENIMLSKNELNLYLGQWWVQLKLDDGCTTLEISCRDIEALHSVKQAVMELFTTNTPGILDPMKIYQNATMDLFTTHYSSYNHIHNVWTCWRELVSSRLPVRVYLNEVSFC